MESYIADPDLNALYLRRNEIFKSLPRCNFAASPEAKREYEAKADAWHAAMREIDGQIAAARKAGVK